MFTLLPSQAEVRGLLGLMLLHESRHLARVNDQGDFVLLGEQGCTPWWDAQVAEGCALTEQALRTPPMQTCSAG